MNAITHIAIIGEDEPTQPLKTRWNPDVFRSRLLDKFAEIETWAVGRLRAAHPDKKLQPTLGLKLGAVQKLTETHPRLFKHPANTTKLIDDLRPYQELRSTVAHSIVTTARLPGGSCISVFDRADADAETPWRNRIVLLENDFRQILGRVSNLANQFNQQVPNVP